MEEIKQTKKRQINPRENDVRKKKKIHNGGKKNSHERISRKEERI
jgi:hypothetical protein